MPALPPGRRVPEAPSGGLVAKTSRSSWIPGSYAPPVSKKPHAFLRLWKNKDCKAESMTKVGLDAIGTSTPLASNTSQLSCEVHSHLVVFLGTKAPFRPTGRSSVPAELSSAERVCAGRADLTDGPRPSHRPQSQRKSVCSVPRPFWASTNCEKLSDAENVLCSSSHSDSFYWRRCRDAACFMRWGAGGSLHGYIIRGLEV
jgi:hypothetical protein